MQAAAATAAALRVATRPTAVSAAACQSYPGPWSGIVHGDFHGGNIMVDSRSYAQLIDDSEVEDAHGTKDPAKLECCILYIYTALPIPPEGTWARPRARSAGGWVWEATAAAIVEEATRRADRGGSSRARRSPRCCGAAATAAAAADADVAPPCRPAAADGRRWRDVVVVGGGSGGGGTHRRRQSSPLRAGRRVRRTLRRRRG